MRASHGTGFAPCTCQDLNTVFLAGGVWSDRRRASFSGGIGATVSRGEVGSDGQAHLDCLAGEAGPHRTGDHGGNPLGSPYRSAVRAVLQHCGVGGLQDRVGRGLKPPLSPTEETLFRQRIEAEPQRSGEVCSWRGVDCQHFLETQFGQQKSLSAVSWLLHRLGYETPAQKVRRPSSGRFQKQVPEQIAEIAAQHLDKKIVVFFQDECRFGQQGTLTRKWRRDHHGGGWRWQVEALDRPAI